MKILLVDNYARDHQFSMQKFSACLNKELLDFGHQVKVISPNPVFGKWCESTVSGNAKWLGYLDKYVLFPFVLRKTARWADIVHICDHSNSPYLTIVCHQPHLITCHDMMAVRSALGDFDQNKNISKTGQLQQKWILKSLKNARNIAAVSNATKQDLLRLIEPSSAQVSVVYNGLNYPFKPVARGDALELLRKHGISENMRFLLHVGGNQWYKNRKGMLAIFGQIVAQQPDTDLKLVMAGKPFNDELKALVQEYDLADRLIQAADVSTEELGALYSLAEAFVFPSLCEGFGWPILEAQACGTLVFTSNREPMTEVGGNASIYIDPESYQQAAVTILEALNNPELTSRVKAEMATNVERFTTEKMIAGYLALYRSIIETEAAAS